MGVCLYVNNPEGKTFTLDRYWKSMNPDELHKHRHTTLFIYLLLVMKSCSIDFHLTKTDLKNEDITICLFCIVPI